MELFIDTPSHYNTNALMTRVWTDERGGSVHADMIVDANDGLDGGPAWSSSSANGSAYTYHDQIGQSEFRLGMCLKCTTLPGADKVILGVVDAAGALQVCVVLKTTGKLAVYRGNISAQLGSDSADAITTSTTLEIGFKGTVASIGGSAEVWLGTAGTSTSNARVIAVSGVNTAGGTGETWRGPYIGATTTIFLSHLYVRDGQGVRNNDLEFGWTCGTEFPDAAGIYTGYTPNTGTIQAALDDTAADDDTTYGECSAEDASFTVGMSTVSATPIISSVVVLHQVKNTAAGAGLSYIPRCVLDADTTPLIFDGSFRTPSTSAYKAFRERYEVNPLTGLPWEVSELNAAEFGGYALS
jgi:hypothetical protein